MKHPPSSRQRAAYHEGVSPSTNSQSAWAVIDSIPAGASFTPNSNTGTVLLEQSLPRPAVTVSVAASPVSQSNSAWDEKTIKARSKSKLLICVPSFSQNHCCQICGSCTFSSSDDEDEPLHFLGDLVCPLEGEDEQLDATGFDEDTEARHLKVPIKPTPEQVAAHEETHLPF
eukprot:4866271-Karenia_brevis.AAC.1